MRPRTLWWLAAGSLVLSAWGGGADDLPAADPAAAAAGAAPSASVESTLIPLPSANALVLGGGTTSTDSEVARDPAGKRPAAGVAAAAVSGDGTRLAYLAMDRTARLRLYVKDLRSAKVVAACTSATGEPADRDCLAPVLSADGNAVAFSSRASNLVDGDTNGRVDVFVKDLRTGTVTRVLRADGSQGDRSAYVSGISGDGTRVVFVSQSSLDPDRPVPEQGDVGPSYAYVADLRSGAVTLIAGPDGLAADASPSSAPTISADGNTVVFASAPQDREFGTSGHFAADLRSGAVTSLTKLAGLDLPAGHFLCDASVPSRDGTRVAVQVCEDVEDEDGDVSEPPNETGVYVADLRAGRVVHRVGTAKGKPDLRAENPSLSADGRRLLWTRTVGGNPRAAGPVYLTDLSSGTTRRITREAVERQWSAAETAVSADGRVVAVEFVDQPDDSRRTNLSGDIAVIRLED